MHVVNFDLKIEKSKYYVVVACSLRGKFFTLVQMQFRAPPFLRCGIAFHGFTEADVKEMEEIAMTNGK